jgi:IS5 family transposase
MRHHKAVLARATDWDLLVQKCGPAYSDKPGHPALPTRLMAGLANLKYKDDLSDKELCARWVENPYYQYLCGEEFFRHELPFDRSSMSEAAGAPSVRAQGQTWRERMGEDKGRPVRHSCQGTARQSQSLPSGLIRGTDIRWKP